MIRKLLINIVSIFLLTSCGTNKSDVSSNQISKSSSIYEENTMKLEIDNIEVDVTWLDNDSVNALKMLKPLSINMHQYGDFEQTGNIGQSIIRNDKDINTIPGDIVLYNGNAISVFYAPSSWSYTKLGHINMNDDELNELFNKPSVIFVLK